MWTKREWKQLWEKHRGLILSGGIALLAGGLLAWWWYVPTVPEAALTDQAISEGREDLEEWTRRVDQIADQVREEVTGIREKNKRSVQALPADSIADGLNDELSGFRSVDSGPGGMAEQ